jgi:Ca2+-binding EF-hand superfamily protein
LILNEDDVEFVVANTGFTYEQIKNWHKEFLIKCPTGLINAKQFCTYYKSLMPLNFSERSKVEIALKLFKLFDIDGDGYISYAEYLVSFWIRCQAPIKEKFTWLFNMFDTNSNGRLDYYELRSALTCCMNINDLDDLLEQLNEEKLKYFRKINKSQTFISSSTITSNDEDDEAFYDDNSALSPSFALSNATEKSNGYNIFSKTTKLLNDKLDELIMQLDDALTYNFYEYNKKKPAFNTKPNRLDMKIKTCNINRINLKREDFIGLCSKYKLLRKLLIPIDYFYEYDLIDF